ncbi:MAG: hypothetical protein P8L66_03255 [Rhodospirillaceae bacterium]|nr:hypothetical protein [Rhodospirillaceae bacterium]
MQPIISLKPFIGFPRLYTKPMEQNKALGPSAQDGYNALLDGNFGTRLTSTRAILSPMLQDHSDVAISLEVAEG